MTSQKKKEHLVLSFGAELSLGPRYHCNVCGEDLWTERSERTNFQEWLFAKGGSRRHYKHRCNLAPKSKATNERGEFYDTEK